MSGQRLSSCALRRGALVVALAVSAAPEVARAHIGPAAVKAVVAMESGKPSILLMNEGLAVRRGEAWHYVCPARWGDAEMRDADSAQGGPVMIGADSGLWLFHADGRANAHPDPAGGGGVPLATAATKEHVMQLRLDGDLTRLLRVSPERAEVVFSDLTLWESMGVADDFVVLLSMRTGVIQMLRLATDGTELARETAMGPPTSLGGTTRVVGSTVYLLVKRQLADGSWGVESGLIEDGMWRALHTGVSFAGPTMTATGELIASVDGQLSSFEGHVPRALDLDTVVNCVDDFEGFVYACDSIGLREITPEGPGPALFELLQLQPPELDLVPDGERERCNHQWELYEQDLKWVGSTVSKRDGGVPDGGPVATEGGAPDGGQAATDSGQAGNGSVVSDGAPASNAGGGCGIAGRAGNGHGERWDVPVFLLMTLLLRRARRPRAIATMLISAALLGCGDSDTPAPHVAVDGGHAGRGGDASAPSGNDLLIREAYGALTANDDDARADLITRFDEAADANPDDGYTVFYAGLMRLWRLGEGTVDPGYGLGEQAADSQATVRHLERARELLPEDARIPAFLGVAQVATGRTVGSQALIDQGREALDDAAAEFPAYGHAVRAIALGELATDHPYFPEAEQDLKAVMKACGYVADPDDSTGLAFQYPQEAMPYPRQVCDNRGIVPHVWEGLFLTYGDVVLKTGDAKAARTLYQNAKRSPGYDNWTLKGLLEKRIANSRDLADLYSDADLDNDPITWMGSTEICTGCHADPG